MASFEDRIKDIYTQHQDDRETLARQRERERDDAQDFLARFRDVVNNVILPVFVEANLIPQPLGVRSYPRHDHGRNLASFELSVGDSVHALIFDADYRRQRVLITHNTSSKAKRDRHVTLEMITQDLVQQEVEDFLRAVFEIK